MLYVQRQLHKALLHLGGVFAIHATRLRHCFATKQLVHERRPGTACGASRPSTNAGGPIRTLGKALFSLLFKSTHAFEERVEKEVHEFLSVLVHVVSEALVATLYSGNESRRRQTARLLRL